MERKKHIRGPKIKFTVPETALKKISEYREKEFDLGNLVKNSNFFDDSWELKNDII